MSQCDPTSFAEVTSGGYLRRDREPRIGTGGRRAGAGAVDAPRCTHRWAVARAHRSGAAPAPAAPGPGWRRRTGRTDSPTAGRGTARPGLAGGDTGRATLAGERR